jgi:hypothetical protein
MGNKKKKPSIKLPRYRGASWIEPRIPEHPQPWLLGKR